MLNKKFHKYDYPADDFDNAVDEEEELLWQEGEEDDEESMSLGDAPPRLSVMTLQREDTTNGMTTPTTYTTKTSSQEEDNKESTTTTTTTLPLVGSRHWDEPPPSMMPEQDPERKGRIMEKILGEAHSSSITIPTTSSPPEETYKKHELTLHRSLERATVDELESRDLAIAFQASFLESTARRRTMQEEEKEQLLPQNGYIITKIMKEEEEEKLYALLSPTNYRDIQPAEQRAIEDLFQEQARIQPPCGGGDDKSRMNRQSPTTSKYIDNQEPEHGMHDWNHQPGRPDRAFTIPDTRNPPRLAPCPVLKMTPDNFRREAMDHARHDSNNSLMDLLLALKLNAEESGLDRRASTNRDELFAFEMPQDSRQQRTNFVAGGITTSSSSSTGSRNNTISNADKITGMKHRRSGSINTGSDNNPEDRSYCILQKIRDEQHQRQLTMNHRPTTTSNYLQSQQPAMDESNHRPGGSGAASKQDSGNPPRPAPHPVPKKTQVTFRREAPMDHARHVSNSSLGDLLLALKLSAEEACFVRRTSPNRDELLAFEKSQDSQQELPFDHLPATASSLRSQQRAMDVGNPGPGGSAVTPTIPNKVRSTRPLRQNSISCIDSEGRRQQLLERGTSETKLAIRSGQSHVVTCLGCGGRLQAPISYSLVYCPKCHTISPA